MKGVLLIIPVRRHSRLAQIQVPGHHWLDLRAFVSTCPAVLLCPREPGPVQGFFLLPGSFSLACLCDYITVTHGVCFIRLCFNDQRSINAALIRSYPINQHDLTHNQRETIVIRLKQSVDCLSMLRVLAFMSFMSACRSRQTKSCGQH